MIGHLSAPLGDFGLSRMVRGAGGYVYEQDESGTITIVEGPSGVGTTLTSGPAWSAIAEQIGDYPTADDDGAEGQSPAVLSAVDATVAAFRTGGWKYGLTTALQQAAQHGPQVAEASREYIDTVRNAKNSPTALRAKLAQLQRKRRRFKKQGKKKKARAVGLQIRMLREALVHNQTPIPDVETAPVSIPGPETGLPTWVLPLGLGLGAVAFVGIIARVLRRPRRAEGGARGRV